MDTIPLVIALLIGYVGFIAGLGVNLRRHSSKPHVCAHDEASVLMECGHSRQWRCRACGLRWLERRQWAS